MSAQPVQTIEIDEDFNLDVLKRKIATTGLDKWLSPVVAGAYSQKSQATIQQLMDKGSYTLADGTVCNISVQRNSDGKAVKISARSLIQYAEAPRRKAGFNSGAARTTKNLLVVVPKEFSDAFAEFCAANKIVVRDPSEVAKKYAERKRARMLSVVTSNGTEPTNEATIVVN